MSCNYFKKLLDIKNNYFLAKKGSKLCICLLKVIEHNQAIMKGKQINFECPFSKNHDFNTCSKYVS